MNNKYIKLIGEIGTILKSGRIKAAASINRTLVETYWQIGKKIVEFEQGGKEKALYRSELLNNLSKDLKSRFGKGFGKRNVYDMRKFYLTYRILQTVSAKLSWSHYIELIKIDDANKREFYCAYTIKEGLSVRKLERQIDSLLYERLMLSNGDKNLLSDNVLKGINPQNIIKDPYIFEFLQIPEQTFYSEKDLEQRLIENLQMFLLELGKGFTFVSRQHRISIGISHYYVDLVFYNRLLNCFVLIDLKVGKVKHSDIGQMNLYINYFNKEETKAGENPTIGIVLAAEKDEIEIEYALGGITNRLFVSQYQLYLPDKKVLEDRIREIMN